MVDTLHPPVEVILSFPKPNYVNPESQGPALVVLALILSSVGIVVVGVRLYARFYITKAPGIDDALIVGALVFGMATSVLVIIGNVKYHSGYHVWDIPLSSAVGHRLNVWISQLCFMLALSCVKISVLLFYRRLSVTVTKAFLIATWVGIAYNIAFLCGFILALCLICRPLPAYWLSFDPLWSKTNSYTCGSEQIGQPLIGLLSVIGDFYSAMIPMILVRRLQMSRDQKRGLYILFGLGYLAVIFGIVRAGFLYRIVNVTYDFTWTLWTVWLLGMLEMWVALYAACGPAWKPYFKRALVEKSTSGLRKHAKVYVVSSNSSGGLKSARETSATPQSMRLYSPENRTHRKAPVLTVDEDIEKQRAALQWKSTH